MAQPQDALYFREIVGRMLSRDTNESYVQAFMVAPIRADMPRAERYEIIDIIRRHMHEAVEYGEIYYISPEITAELIRLSDELLKPPKRLYHFQPEDFPSLRGIFYFDGLVELPTAYPRTLAPPTAMDRLRAVVWNQLRVEGQGVTGKVLYTYVDNQHRTIRGKDVTDFATPWLARHWIPMHYGDRLEPGKLVFRRESINEFEQEKLSDEEVDEMVARQQVSAEKITRLLFVLTQFLASEIIARPRTQIPQDHARVLNKEGRPLPLFRTVVLRRAVGVGEKSELGTSPEWSHRWKVRSHWRKQRVGPGRQYIRPTLVTEHWKGPEDKPMDLRPTIQAVVR